MQKLILLLPLLLLLFGCVGQQSNLQDPVAQLAEQNRILSLTNSQLSDAVNSLSNNVSLMQDKLKSCQSTSTYLVKDCNNFRDLAMPTHLARSVNCGTVLIGMGFGIDEGFCWNEFGSKSMSPIFGNSNYTLVFLKQTDVYNLNVGDIVLVEKNGTNLVHRVVFKGNDSGVWTISAKGDNNSEPDGIFTNIKGKLIAVIY